MKLRCLLCVLVLLLATPVTAGEALKRTKQAYGFDNWPGRNGELKQGLALKSLDLSPYEIMAARNRLSTSGEMILRYGAEGAERPAFEVAVRVLDSVSESQEQLAEFLGTCTARLPAGNSFGLEIGDVCFAAKYEDLFKCIVFARNNIFIRVSAMEAACASETEIPLDISQVAVKIDNQVKQAEKADSTEDLNKPAIQEFSAATGTAKAGVPAELSLSVSDPKDEELEIHFDEGGGMLYEQDGKRYFKAEKPGKYTVTVYVINEHFLVSRKGVTIEVVK